MCCSLSLSLLSSSLFDHTQGNDLDTLGGRREEEEEEEEKMMAATPTLSTITTLSFPRARKRENWRNITHHLFLILRVQYTVALFLPNQQRTLNKLPTELQCRNFVSKHRLSMQIGAERMQETCMQCVRIYFNWSSISLTTVGGWVNFFLSLLLDCRHESPLQQSGFGRGRLHLPTFHQLLKVGVAKALLKMSRKKK